MGFNIVLSVLVERVCLEFTFEMKAAMDTNILNGSQNPLKVCETRL